MTAWAASSFCAAALSCFTRDFFAVLILCFLRAESVAEPRVLQQVRWTEPSEMYVYALLYMFLSSKKMCIVINSKMKEFLAKL